jgi:hypothetical protein
MAGTLENFRINLNQNLWGLLVSFGFLGGAEYFHLCVLFWFSTVPAAVMVISVCITTWVYTSNYTSNKRSKSG